MRESTRYDSQPPIPTFVFPFFFSPHALGQEQLAQAARATTAKAAEELLLKVSPLPPPLPGCCLFKSMCSCVSRQTCGCIVHPYCLRLFFFFLFNLTAADFFLLFCAAFRERASEALRCGARAEGRAVSFLCGDGCELEEGLTRHVHSSMIAIRTRIEEYEDKC